MQKIVSFDPPGRVERAERPIRRRHVLYVPGYDPEAKGRARMLFVRELARYAKRFGLTERSVGKVEQVADLPGLRWHVSAAKNAWSTQTVFEVLSWDDIVIRDFRRPVAIRVALLFAGLVDSLVSGVLIRFGRLSWKFAGVILYPCVMILALIAIALAVGVVAERVLGSVVSVPSLAAYPIVLIVACVVFRLASPLGARWFVWHLLHDWVFNWQHGNGWRKDYEERVESFAAHLVEVAKNTQADEILVVGHSSGSVMALEIVARALVRDCDLGRRDPSVCILTIGSCLPLVALNPRAVRCREGLASVASCEEIYWAEYQAPQDWLNFTAFEPNRDLGLGISADRAFNPVIRSPRFKETVSPATYASILYRPFRMHFQFLMANDRPGEYDFIMMMVGPVSLPDRIKLGHAATERALGIMSDLDGLSDADFIARETGRLAP